MHRRTWVKGTLAGTALVACGAGPAAAARVPWRRLQATSVEAPSSPLPEGKRIPFGWSAFAVPEHGEATLRWKGALPRPPTDAHLRCTVALDVREEKKLDVLLASSGEHVGTMDVRYAPYLQIVEVPLRAEHAALAAKQGLRLVSRQGTTPLWLFAPDADADGRGLSRRALTPHLLFSDGQRPSWATFQDALLSLASVQPFGWMEGCVLEGLVDMETRLGPRVRPTLDGHLALFFDDQGRLSYESPRSAPVTDEIAGIEQGLPIAALARRRPGHPVLETFLRFCRDRERDGVIQDGTTTSTEGAYTIAYPLAVLARQRREPDLAKLALRQLEHRRARLVTADAISQARHGDEPDPRLRNWARGVAWYLLGVARTIAELGPGDDTAAFRAELQRAATWIVRHQHASGLWTCFVDQPDTGVETSGAAGIAAALGFAARRGLLPSAFRSSAMRAYRALPAHFAPDGLLRGAAQSNRAGEALQRSSYRVIYQVGMGLTAQLRAAVS